MNKISILINWSREIDMYENFIKIIPSDKVDIIINDIKSFEKERKNNSSDIEKTLTLQNKKFRFFSEIFNKEKYKVLISTGQASSLKISFYSIFRFIYGQLIGRFLEFTNISKILIKIFNRPFTADGKKCQVGMIWYPERKIGKTVIKFPSGMDLKLKHYPNNDLEKNFDIFFTHSQLENDLIKKKFQKKICKVIGYPRYDLLDQKQDILNELNNDFKLDIRKKIIFWTPTHIHYSKETHINFLPWVEKISELRKYYNIIVRPHPKSLKVLPELKEKLTQKGFFVDTKSDRKIGNIFKVSDLVLCDYGGTIFSAIYLEKPIVLLNMDYKSEFIKDLKNNISLDLEIRSDLANIDLKSRTEEIKLKILNSLDLNYKNKILDMKKKYFGNYRKDLHAEIKSFLLNYLS